MKKKEKVIGIIMTYNAAALVADTYQRIPRGTLDDVIIVDDGSTDDIRSEARKLKLPLFSHRHLGYGGNIKFGLAKARARGATTMVEIHGDGQYDPGAIPAAIQKINAGYDFVLGSRFTTLSWARTDGMPWERFLANLGLSAVDRFVLGLHLSEFHTGFRVYTRKLIDTIGFDNTSNDYLYSFEIIAQAAYYGMRVGEVPVHCNYRSAHTSVSVKKAAVYSFQTMRILGQYLLAKLGVKSKLFHR